MALGIIIAGEQENRVLYELRAWAGLSTRMYYRETVYSGELGSVDNGRKRFVPPHLRPRSLSSFSVEDRGYCLEEARWRKKELRNSKLVEKTGGGQVTALTKDRVGTCPLSTPPLVSSCLKTNSPANFSMRDPQHEDNFYTKVAYRSLGERQRNT